MPNRYLKDSIRRSPSLSALSDAGERLWYRIIASVDDFGRYEADPEVLLSACFQRKPKGWNEAKVSQTLHELATSTIEGEPPLILLYTHQGRAYLQITKASEHIQRRAEHSRYPDPAKCQPMQVAASPRQHSPEATSKPDAAVERFETLFWKPYPDRDGKKLEKGVALKRFLALSEEDQELCCKAVAHYAASRAVQEGVGIRDPKRFLLSGGGHEFWREWIEPETQRISGKTPTCIWSVRPEGSQRMRVCGEPIAPPDINPKRRPLCARCLPLRDALEQKAPK